MYQSATSHYLQSVFFSRGSVVRVFLNPNCGKKDKKKKKKNYFSSLSLGCFVWNNKTSRNAEHEANKPRTKKCWTFPGKSATTEPSHMGKNTLWTLPTFWISSHRWTVLWRHTWRYISNIGGMFKYIAGTNWSAFPCIFCFFRVHICEHDPSPNHSPPTPPTQSLKEAYLKKKWKHCMLPMYVCLQDMCFCIFFGLRRCSCVWMSHVFLLFLFFHYLIYFLFFFNCASLHVYECLLTHISRGDSAPMTWLTRVCVCVSLFSVAARSPLRAEHHHGGRRGGVPASL